MRAIALMLCLALAACSGMSAVPDSNPSVGEARPTGMGPAAAEQAAPPTPPPPSATAAPQRRETQALGGTSAPPAPPPQTQPALSGEEQVLAIRQSCWSAADRNRALKGLEARADWVGKCIADKTKELGQ